MTIAQDKTTYDNMPEGYHPWVYQHPDATKIMMVLVNRQRAGCQDFDIPSETPVWEVEKLIEQAIIEEWRKETPTPGATCQQVMNSIMEQWQTYLLESGEYDAYRRGAEWEVCFEGPYKRDFKDDPYPSRGSAVQQFRWRIAHAQQFGPFAWSAAGSDKWPVFFTQVLPFMLKYNAYSVRYLKMRMPRQHGGPLPRLMNIPGAEEE